MNNLRVAAAQFENQSGDKNYNLAVIDRLAGEASQAGAQVIAFHECSVTGYTFARDLTRRQLLELAEAIPDGGSIQKLRQTAARHEIVVLAGLFEKDAAGNLFNTYVCVDKNGVIARHRKLHPFINPHLAPGDSYTVFEISGWKCGILICYDNNVVENVRATVLLGAGILFMPHVTMCTTSSRPGAGFVDPQLWHNRQADPTSLRAEFDGLKGRAWLIKWAPARAYDNGVYVVFTNPIGMDDDQLKNGCAMLIDPFGDILAECRKLGDEMVVAMFTPEKLRQAGGYRYRQARRPDLYADIVGRSHTAEQKVIWMKDSSQ